MNANNEIYVSNLVNYVLEKTGSIFGTVKTKLTAKEQRELFGQFLGRGTIIINGADETIKHRVKVDFGRDYDYTANLKWGEL